MSRSAFIIYTHYLSARIVKLIERARAELSETHEVLLLGYFQERESIPEDFASVQGAAGCTLADLSTLGFPDVADKPGYRTVPGDTDMPIHWLFNGKGPFKEVWLFEGDAEFTGSLRDLVSHFEGVESDLLVSYLGKVGAEWPHFRSRRLPEGWPDPEETRLGAFLPVFRASGRLIEAVQDFYRSGGRGHYEWVWPQIAVKNGYRCCDFNEFPFKGRPLYRPQPMFGIPFGTFRYRPAMANPGSRRNTLWHPVKDRPVPLREYREFSTQLRRRIQKRLLGKTPGKTP